MICCSIWDSYCRIHRSSGSTARIYYSWWNSQDILWKEKWRIVIIFSFLLYPYIHIISYVILPRSITVLYIYPTVFYPDPYFILLTILVYHAVYPTHIPDKSCSILPTSWYILQYPTHIPGMSCCLLPKSLVNPAVSYSNPWHILQNPTQIPCISYSILPT